MRNEPITVYGDGSQSRCFCDVRDVVEAIYGLSQHPQAPGQVYNIGGRQEISMRELAERIKTIVGSTSSLQFVPYEEAYAPGFEDMQRRVPDTTRIEKMLGWQPQRTLDEILTVVHDYEKQSGEPLTN